MNIKFKCNQIENENIPIEIVGNLGLKFPDLHTNQNSIASISKAIRDLKNDSICKVPFCTTVEAEALGASINLGDDKNCPRIKNHIYNNVEELTNIKNIDFESGRISEVLKSIDILSKDNIVTLNVCGSMTIISLLIDLKYFYKGVKKNKDIIENFMNILEENIVAYIVNGYENGARIISYSDPVGDINMVGPKVYKEIVAPYTINIIKKATKKIDGSIIHLCGKTSEALYNLDLCDLDEIKYDESLSYGEAIVKLLDNNDVKIIGNNCMKRTPFKTKNSLIYEVKINKD